MNRDQFRRKSRTLRRLSHFQLLYSVFTLILAVPTTLVALMLWVGDTSLVLPANRVFIAVLLGLGAYGLVAAALMLRARNELLRMTPRAITWTRLALALAIPGSLLTAGIGAFLILLDHWLPFAIGLGFLAGTILNVGALIRGGFNDLDDAIWLVEASRRGLSDLNYVEDD